MTFLAKGSLDFHAERTVTASAANATLTIEDINLADSNIFVYPNYLSHKDEFNEPGENYIIYAGRISKEKLITKINTSEIKCISSSKDRYKRHIATCFKGKTNLNQWMVRNGYAIAYRRYSKKYVPDEEFAKENKLGLWQGKFMNPEKWRKLN